MHVQLVEMAYRVGKLESGLENLQARSDDRWGLVMMHLRRNGNGTKDHGKRLPWMQIAAMATVAITSIVGLISPEKAAALLRALIH
jgi:hypothetical protein